MYEIIKGRFWYTVAPRNSGSLTYVVEWWMYMYVWVSRYGGRAKRDDEVTVRAACYLCWYALLLEYVGTGVLGCWYLGEVTTLLNRWGFEPTALPSSQYTQYTQYAEKLARWLAGWYRCQHVDLSGVLLTKAPLLHCYSPTHHGFSRCRNITDGGLVGKIESATWFFALVQFSWLFESAPYNLQFPPARSWYHPLYLHHFKSPLHQLHICSNWFSLIPFVI